MSNSNSKFIRNNFSKKQYNIKKLKISRGLCPNSDKRNTEYELLIKKFLKFTRIKKNSFFFIKIYLFSKKIFYIYYFFLLFYYFLDFSTENVLF